jgi:hypothetical protein
MAERKAQSSEGMLEIPVFETQMMEVALLGTTPIILNRLNEKAQRELLAPQGRRNAAARQASLKHDPYAEFRASPYTLLPTAEDPSPLTYVAAQSSWFKKGMMLAALDIPGAKKAQIGRLIWVESDVTPLFGRPQLFMRYVRSADINRTPDIRTRAIVPQWACVIAVSFATRLISAQSIINLLSAAGKISGAGDWRNEKGSASFGQFAVVDPNDVRLGEILQQGYTVQREAMEQAEPYDEESRELLAHWTQATKEKRFTFRHPGQGDETEIETETDTDPDPDPDNMSNGVPGEPAQPKKARQGGRHARR